MINAMKSRTITVPQSTSTGPASDGASAAINISDLTGANGTGPDVLVTQSGTNTTGTFKVQVSADGSTWFDVGADISAAASRSLAKDYPLVRVKCTANVSGASNVFAAAVIGVPRLAPV